MTTNRYTETMIKKNTPPKRNIFLSQNVDKDDNSFVTREELASFSERILGSFQVVFEALDEHTKQSAYNTDTIESLVNAIETLNKENEKRHRELLVALEKIAKKK
jgi:hypothetical protein